MRLKYKNICKTCNFSNLPGTNYCQNCGSLLKNQGNFILNLKYILNNGQGKGISIAPLVMRNIEDNSKNNPDLQLVKRRKYVKVIPLSNNSWYCPDCGTYNKAMCFNCNGCGREFHTS